MLAWVVLLYLGMGFAQDQNRAGEPAWTSEQHAQWEEVERLRASSLTAQQEGDFLRAEALSSRECELLEPALIQLILVQLFLVSCQPARCLQKFSFELPLPCLNLQNL